MKKELLRFILYAAIIGTLTSAFVGAEASDVPFANEPFDVNNIPEPAPPPPAVRDFFQLDPYYQQWINVRGFPVLASAEVRPYTVKEAAWQIGQMVGHRPDILKAMAQIKARFSIVPHNKHLPEIPEYDFGRLNFFWEMRARGVGGQTTTSPEENIICGDSHYCYAEVIHEFAHQLHDWGYGIDSTFDSRLETMYNAALQEGLYQENYAGTNRHEYWAEGVGSWFNGPNLTSNVAHTREALKEYDPRLATLLTEVFGDGNWRYTPPAIRTHLPHLQGFNPQEAPIYQRPPRLLELEQQLLDPNSDGGGKWVNLELYHPSALSHLKKLTRGGNHTDFLVRNLTGINLALYFFNADGKKILHQYIGTNDFLAVGTEVGAIWLIQDHTGKDLAVFRAEEEVGRVLITPTLNLITPGLSIVSGDNQSGVSGAVLANPFVVELRDLSDGLPRYGGWVTFTVTAGDGTLNVTRTTTDANGRAQSTLTLGPNRGTNTVSVSAEGHTVTFNAVAWAASDLPFGNEPFDVNNIPEPVPPPKEVRDFFGLSDFWQQWINIEGFPVLGSAAASPYAVKELAWQIGQMFRGKTELLKELAKNKHTYTVIGHDEVFGDIPEMHQSPHLRPSLLFYHNVRAGGGWSPRLGSSVVEVLGSASTPIHELAHDIHLFVFNRIDWTFDDRLKALYNTVIAKGLWYGAASDYLEYWAEAVTVWFHVPQLSPVKTREALKAYDPDIALLIAEIFGDNDWRYTPIESRLHLPHLQGFDPQSAPLDRELPPGVREAYEELRDPAINERDEWVNLPPYDPSMLPRLNELRNRNQADRYSVGRTDVLVANTIDDQIWLYWVNPDGTETLRWRIHPKAWAIAHFSCRVGDLLLAKDNTGRPLAVFQAVEKVGRVLLTPTFHLIKPGLSKVSGDSQTGISGAVLANPFVVEVRGESLSVLEGISVTFTVTAGDGTLSATHTTTDENGRAESTLTLGQNPGTNTVSVSATGIERTVTFNVVAEAAIDIPDAKLRDAIETTLGKAEGYPITPSEMATLPRLEAPNTNITDLTGLEGATNLTYLNLGHVYVNGRPINSNSLSNISLLAGLTNLKWLSLDNNNITDISALSGLTNLTWLNLGSNAISDISALSGLTNLKTLWLQDNNITDISPLVANTGLDSGDSLNVKGNPLNYQSIHTHILTLQSKGVLVEFDNRPSVNTLDVNSDGVVNLFDLTSVASPFGSRGKSKADVNGDGVIDIVDLLWVGAAPISSLSQQAVETLTVAEVQNWLTGAKQLHVQNEILKDGIIVLEQLLAMLTHQGHTNHVWSVAFSPDGSMLASGSWDKTVRLWDVATEQLLFTLFGHTGSVMSVAFSPDGATLASGSWDGTIRLWNPHTGQLKRTLTSHRSSVASVTFGPDGRLLASGSTDATIRLWNTTTWQIERTLTGHTDVVEVVVFSPDGAILASGSRDKTIRLWNPHTRQLLHTLVEHRSEINRLTFSPDGSTLASGSWDKVIRLWNPHTGQLKRTLPNQGGWVNAVAFSPDGATLVIGNRGISLWDIETGQYKKPLIEDIGDAISVVFSPDGQTLASGSGDSTVRLWEIGLPSLPEYTLLIPERMSLIHIPLKVTEVGGKAQTIKSVSELYDALLAPSGESKVLFLATYDSQTQQWAGYFGPADEGTPGNKELTDDTGILANMIAETSVHLTGKPLGANGTSTITLTPEFNVVGLPLRDSGINHVSDLLTLEGIKDNVNAIIFTDKGDWKLVTQAGDPSDIPIVGGQAFMLYAQRTETVTISGQGWDNTATMAAAPPVDLHSPLQVSK